ncbi:MAG TPA: hypothetical protein ENJ44_01535, partial [Oceanospirillales bacterium]|nr:hypothetical protein [Oceanospirillales bacterium]
MKNFEKRCGDLVELIYNSFEDMPYPEYLPIGIKKCRSQYIGHEFHSNSDTEEIEIIFRGGTGELFYELAYESEQARFDGFVKQNKPLKWR